eukprot:s1726_g6.t2
MEPSASEQMWPWTKQRPETQAVSGFGALEGIEGSFTQVLQGGQERILTEQRISELESRLALQQSMNQNMFRRLQLLEEVLQVERDKRCRLLEALVGEATTPRKRRGMQGSRQQENLAESLLARKILPSTRVTLQLAMPELGSLFGRASPEWEGPAEADPLQRL